MPDALSSVVMKAMSNQPDDRYQDVMELQDEISAYQMDFATSAEEAGILGTAGKAWKSTWNLYEMS